MVALTALLTYVLLSSSPVTVSAAPAETARIDSFPRLDVGALLCKLPLIRHLCPRGGTPKKEISTPLGIAKGASPVSGARHFAVRYATANRWQESTVVTQWQLPNGATDPAVMPKACPQNNADEADTSEDCLSMILYVPDNIGSNANTLVWIPGGSFIGGSATGPGLDGSKLAIATNSIVAVIQHRLGALGFLAPNGPTNLAVKDVINALQFLKTVVPSFGGSASHITISGQSSGATMVRSLLAAPSASSLFKSAILASDPMDYGILYSNTQNTLQEYFNSLISCSPSDTACLNALTLDEIISAELDVYFDANSMDGAAGQGSPIRPVQDGNLITNPLDLTAPFPSVSKPILITSVMNEAAFNIYYNFKQSFDADTFGLIVTGTFQSPRAETVLGSSHYQLPEGSDPRPILERMGTDYLWKCSAWTFARNWVQNGGNAYVGLYTAGATYPGNERVPVCAPGGAICHQDDIQIIFGTVQNPTASQTALINEVQKRFKSFLSDGNPNAPGLANWRAATSTDVRAKLLGSSGEAALGACDPTFWGANPEYDYQFYRD